MKGGGDLSMGNFVAHDVHQERRGRRRGMGEMGGGEVGEIGSRGKKSRFFFKTDAGNSFKQLQEIVFRAVLQSIP